MNLPIRKLLLASMAALATMAMTTARAHDVLVNGDFHDGKTHWQGDGEAPDVGGKLIITLKPDKWTAVKQTFSDSSHAAQLKVTYQFSDDCSLLNKRSADAIVPPLTSHAIEQATGLDNGIYDMTMSPEVQWVICMVSGGYCIWSDYVYYDQKKENPRTYSTTITAWGNFNEDALCLAFPPGTGTVTITSVSIVGAKSD